MQLQCDDLQRASIEGGLVPTASTSYKLIMGIVGGPSRRFERRFVAECVQTAFRQRSPKSVGDSPGQAPPSVMTYRDNTGCDYNYIREWPSLQAVSLGVESSKWSGMKATHGRK